MHSFYRTLLACLLGGAVFPVLAQSDFIKPGDERFTFALGYVLNSFYTDLRVDNPALGQGSNVNLRDDLAIERDQDSIWVSAEWRFAPRHRIGFSYSTYNLSGTRTATRQMQIGDEVYPVGATLTSELKAEIFPIQYSYSLLKNESQELAATVGLHWSRFDFKVSGSASAGSIDTDNVNASKLNAPLPLIGLRYDHNFSRHWSAGLKGGVFALKFGEGTTNVEGKVWNFDVYGEYRFQKNLGVGLQITGFNLDVDASSNSWHGEVHYRVWGPQVYLRARF